MIFLAFISKTHKEKLTRRGIGMIIERMIQLSTYKEKKNVIELQEQKVKSIDEYLEMQNIYKAAMQEVTKKLETVDVKFQKKYKRNPIHHMESRLKTLESINNKLKRKGYEPNIRNAQEVLTDIAGVRVICNYIDDIYAVADMLCKQKEIKLVDSRDYIKNPKPNGYRSLHIIVTVPVCIQDKVNLTPVEIQIRTIAMDFWASLEHQIHYKSSECEFAPDNLLNRLKSCADRIAKIDEEMQNINKELQDLPMKDGS